MAERHRRDGVSLVLGLLLVAVAALFLLVDVTGQELDLRWVAPLVLIGAGAAGVVASLGRR